MVQLQAHAKAMRSTRPRRTFEVRRRRIDDWLLRIRPKLLQRVRRAVIDRMLKDAQAHSDDHKRRKEEVEARNSADSIAYQVERQIGELGDRVAVNEKARAEQLIGEIREQVKSNSTDVSRLRQLASDLQQVAHALSSAAYSQAATGSSANGSAGSHPNGHTGTTDDVIDAEFKQTK
jgi:molecular chaperone DnaK